MRSTPYQTLHPLNARACPGGIILHHTLHYQIQEALKTRDFLKDSARDDILSNRHQERLATCSPPRLLVIAWIFTFSCSICGVLTDRSSFGVNVGECPPVFTRVLTVKDVGLNCAVFHYYAYYIFLLRVLIPSSEATMQRIANRTYS